jgi:hypothetical protein
MKEKYHSYHKFFKLIFQNKYFNFKIQQKALYCIGAYKFVQIKIVSM